MVVFDSNKIVLKKKKICMLCKRKKYIGIILWLNPIANLGESDN